MSHKTTIIGDYKIVGSIGSGAYGTVCMGLKNDIYYAIKSMEVIDRYNDPVTSTLVETSILQCLDHPNIAKPVDYYMHGNGVMYMVMPYGGQSLSHRIFHPNDVRIMIWKLLLAIRHMKRNKVIHEI